MVSIVNNHNDAKTMPFKIALRYDDISFNLLCSLNIQLMRYVAFN